jgi:hypothetical protein
MPCCTVLLLPHACCTGTVQVQEMDDMMGWDGMGWGRDGWGVIKGRAASEHGNPSLLAHPRVSRRERAKVRGKQEEAGGCSK